MLLKTTNPIFTRHTTYAHTEAARSPLILLLIAETNIFNLSYIYQIADTARAFDRTS